MKTFLVHVFFLLNTCTCVVVNPILPVTRMSCTSEITVAINKPKKKETLI